MLEIILIVLWFLVGFASFVYFWTRDWDFTPSELSVAVFSGFLGFLAIPLGMLIHPNKEATILIKKRKC